jgi:hypothetical protein
MGEQASFKQHGRSFPAPVSDPQRECESKVRIAGVASASNLFARVIEFSYNLDYDPIKNRIMIQSL